MAKAPPPPPAPPASGGKKNAYTRYIQQHSALKPYADRIKYWAGQYGLDPTYFAALIFFESGGKAKVVSPKGAVGLGQILASAHVGEYVPWLGRRLKRADLDNPEINLHYSAMYFRQQKDKYGGYDAAYRKGYNSGYTGPSPFRGLGVPSATGAAPQDSAGRSVETSTAKSQLLQGQAFADEWHNRIDPIWEAYTGKRATRAQAGAVLRNGWSDYHLELQLTKSKSFVGSPVWLSKAPGYQDVYKQIYGENKGADRQLVAYAIIHNLDGQGFASLLRQRKDYVKSNEFKTNAAQLDTIYRRIYGSPDGSGSNTIKQAVLNGWNPDEFARFLRAQPEYSKSQEFQSNTMNVLGALGLVTGTGVTLNPGQPSPYQSPTQVNAPPPDKRVHGPSGVGGGPSYTPGLSG